MEIRQFRVVLRAKSFERTCRFWGESLALPNVGGWQRPGLVGALFEAGSGVVEVVARSGGPSGERDEAFEYQGPEQKMTLSLIVPSAEKAYETIFFRDRNIPGGLRSDPDGGLIFETHDPDGVKVLFREARGG